MGRSRRRRTLENPAKLHIAKALAEHLHQLGNNYVALARAISEANQVGRSDKDAVDRRKLKKIVEDDPELVLSVAELHALDRYLEPSGAGLAYNSFFLQANALQAIADAGRPVSFLIGAKPVEEARLNLDLWDVKALTEILRGLNSFSPDVRFDIHDVLLHEAVDDARRSVTSDDWTQRLDDAGPSLICLGSSRAIHAAELMLSRMFQTVPFQDSAEAKSHIPFHFSWCPDLDHVFPSAFRYTAEELARHDVDAARLVAERKSSALEVCGTVFPDHHKQRGTLESYGVCVAQRRKSGQIWLVLAGVTGPATYAAARLASRLPLDQRLLHSQQSSPVHWAAVRATLQRDRDRAFGTALSVEKEEILVGPNQCDPSSS